MNVALARNLVMGLSIVMLGACTSSNNPETDQQTGEVTATQDTPKENMREGWQDIKQGTRETAQGVGDATENAAERAAAEVREAGRELKASACPVIGNRTTKRFYTQTDQEYPAMLKGEKILQDDQRECFMSERAALDDGYIKAR